MTQNEALRLALEVLKAAYVPVDLDKQREKAITAIKEALANEALDKMAENARELGLDYEPAQRTWVGLDEEDYIKAYELCDFDKVAAFDFFESKLKEKNT